MSVPVTSSAPNQVRHESNFDLEQPRRRTAAGAKESFKTTELIVYVLAVVGVLVVSVVININKSGDSAPARAGSSRPCRRYMIRRGLAKSGRHDTTPEPTVPALNLTPTKHDLAPIF